MSNKIEITGTRVLSDNWAVLKEITFNYRKKDNTWNKQTREVLDRGDGAAILLYNQPTNNVILTRQFRMATYQQGHPSGMLIEACAGHLDEDNPEEAIRRETEEETGYRVSQVRKIFEAYMSPGAMTEVLHFFVAAYSHEMKVSEGGGLKEEYEEIEVLEYSFQQALKMITTGEIKDAKTIMLLQYAQVNRLLSWE